jgi:hypothetical protein
MAAKKRQLEGGDGILGRGSANKAAYMANVRSLQSQYEKGKVNQDTMNAGLSRASQQYADAGGATSGASYTSFNPTLDPGISKIVNDTASTIAKSKETEREYINSVQDSQGNYYDKTTNVKITPANMISIGVANKMLGNPEIMSRLKEQESLGLLVGVDGQPQTVPEHIQYTALSAQAEYAVNKTSESLDAPGTKMKARGDRTQFSGDMSILQHNYARKLDKDNSLLSAEQLSSSTRVGIRGAAISTIRNSKLNHEKSNEETYNSKSDKKQLTIKNIYQKLVDGGELSKNDSFFSNKSFNTIGKKLDEINEIRFNEQPVIHEYSKSKTDNLQRRLLANGQNFTFYGVNGESVTNPFINDGTDKWVNPSKTNTQVVGELDPINSMSLNLKKESRPNMATPVIVKVGGNQYLMSRSNNELAGDQYRVDLKVNNIYQSILNNGLEPETIVKDDGTKYEFNYNDSHKRFEVSMDGRKMQEMDSEQLRNFISKEGLQ